jgi:glycosyltransferase involved in cell wall biosynthesis
MFALGLRQAGADTFDFDPTTGVAGSDLDILHIHWPEQVFWAGGGRLKVLSRLFKTLWTLRMLKKAGVKIVWMVHNIAPHDLSKKQLPLWLLFRQFLYRMTDGFMTLSPATIDAVRGELAGLKSKPAEYSWHPSFARSVESRPRPQIRAQLGFSNSNRVLGILGLLRPYKGIETLIEVFQTLPDPDTRLLIVGMPIDAAYGDSLSRSVKSDRRIVLLPEHMSDTVFAEYLSASDLIVLPFQKILHSGSIIHALSEHRPVLTLKTPFSTSLRDVVGEDWITTYDGSLQASHLACIKFPDQAPKLDAFSTVEAGKRAVEFYKRLLCKG